jgi:cytochrome P450
MSTSPAQPTTPAETTGQEPRDTAYWAHDITTLKVAAMPAEAVNLNVEGKRSVGPLQGFGSMWEKTYRARFSRQEPCVRLRMGRSDIPSIYEAPLIGSLRHFGANRLGFLSHVAETCGDIGLFHLGPLRAILLNSPELIQATLVEQEDAFDKGWILRHVPRSILGNGLLFSEGEFHRRQRKRVAPSFQSRNMAGYADTIVSIADQAQQTWAEGATIQLDREMGQLALTILNRTLFSADIFTTTDALGKIITTPRRSIRDAGLGILMLSLALPLPGSIGVRRAILESRARIEALIRYRRNAGVMPDDLLTALMQAQDRDGTRMTSEEVRDEALTLFLAGQRNTTDALAWCFAMLAMHPRAHERLQDEVDRVLGGRFATYPDLRQLPYALQICKEVLRLYPPAYIIGRTAVRRVKLGQHTLHPGDIALISPYIMQRRPDYYPHPDRFDPERFSVLSEAKLPRYAYMPFGVGPRTCIGNHFTMMALHLVLSTLAQHIRFSSPVDRPVEGEVVFTLRPRRGTSLMVHRREPANAM